MYTAQELQVWGQAELIELVLEQQKLIEQAKAIIEESINTLKEVQKNAIN